MTLSADSSAGFDRVAVIIPALDPSSELVAYVSALLDKGFGEVIVVDDGSGPTGKAVFAALPAHPRLTVLRHAINFGKGRALKTAFNHCLNSGKELAGVVTADADGQHSIADVVRIAAVLAQRAAKGEMPGVVLGARRLRPGIPLRSLVGNQLTRLVFRLTNGTWLSDTQTGLRGFALGLLPQLLAIEGERYEYETAVLMAVTAARHPLVEEPIETIYIEGNSSSHFNVLRDSMLIYFLLLRFFLSSLCASVVDFVVFVLVVAFGGSVPLAMVSGRGVALGFNFSMNKRLVFHRRDGGLFVFLRYLALVFLLGVLSYLLIGWLQATLGLGTLAAKLVAESTLFVLSFSTQRELVFTDGKIKAGSH